MASICNDERASLGVTSGHDRKTLKLSVPRGSVDLPQFVKDEFDAFLECGILAHGFLRLRCGDCGHDKLVAFSCKRRGFCPSCGARRMAQTAAHLVGRVIPHVPVRQWVLIWVMRLPIPPSPGTVSPLGQRPTSTSTCTAWCWTACTGAAPTGRRNSSKVLRPPRKRFRRCCTRSSPARRKLLTRRGVLVEEEGSTYMADNDGDSDEARTLRPLQAAACTYRIAFGPRAGQKVLTVQGIMPREKDFKQTLCADIDGFSLHAAVRCGADDRRVRSSCAAPSPARWPTNACKPTPRARWCRSSRRPGAMAPRSW